MVMQVLHFAASVSPTQDAAFMVSIAWTALNLILSNFFISVRELSLSALAPLRYVSAMGFAYEGLLRAELHQRTFNCSKVLCCGVVWCGVLCCAFNCSAVLCCAVL
jgi:ABC-type multidrug transport system permease subunit